MGKHCAICGAPSSSYVLCIKHNLMKAKGEVTKCENCGTWYEVKDGCPNCNKTAQKEINQHEITQCKICGKDSWGYYQCKDCYKDICNFMDTFDKNNTVRKFRDYYYNLKERIIIINDLEEARKQCKRLVAMAIINQNINGDSSLMDRVYKDVETLLIKKQHVIVENPKIAEERKERDKNKSKINTAQDGHNLDSDMEVRIDDILYNSFILHAAGKNVSEITESRKKCDWYVPICNGKGIYIEYWGKDDDNYLETRKEKEELYKKYNIPYIGIEKDDPKKDTLTFQSNLIRDLKNLAEKIYGFMPEWKR